MQTRTSSNPAGRQQQQRRDGSTKFSMHKACRNNGNAQSRAKSKQQKEKAQHESEVLAAAKQLPHVFPLSHRTKRTCCAFACFRCLQLATGSGNWQGATGRGQLQLSIPIRSLSVGFDFPLMRQTRLKSTTTNLHSTVQFCILCLFQEQHHQQQQHQHQQQQQHQQQHHPNNGNNSKNNSSPARSQSLSLFNATRGTQRKFPTFICHVGRAFLPSKTSLTDNICAVPSRGQRVSSS